MSLASNQDVDLLDPLSAFYRLEGMALPAVAAIEGTAMPSPYRDLLVHERDMTSTLEDHHGDRVLLETLRVSRGDRNLLRLVILVTQGTRHLVEVGAVRITLDLLDPPAREQIRACRIPLGAILRDHEVEYVSRPSAYLRVESDGWFNQVFGLEEPGVLYGRRNILSTRGGAPFAEAVEFLPPMD